MKTRMEMVITSLATGFWALATTLMIIETMMGGASLIIAGWALLIALWACVWTGWALLLQERHRVETICQLVLSGQDEDGLRSV
jgi:hypothetical protein